MQPLRELQYGKVSASELVQAVNEILSAAGINMDVEKQALMQRTIALQENLRESQAALLLEQVSGLQPFRTYDLCVKLCVSETVLYRKVGETGPQILSNVYILLKGLNDSVTF